MSSAYTLVKSNSITAPLDSVSTNSSEYFPAVVGYFRLTVTTGEAKDSDDIKAVVLSVPASLNALVTQLDIVVPNGIDPSFAVALEHAANVKV